jgi:hypothetical protein
MPSRTWVKLLAVALALAVASLARAAGAADARLTDLNSFWAEISRAVQSGDFAAYAATCHPDGVLVLGEKQTTLPLARALASWQPGFADTKSGKIKASVEFRFRRRIGDAGTAHESGIFCYTSVDAAGQSTAAYVHFEVLLVKKDRWLTLMEHQQKEASAAEWAALK